MLTSIRSSMTVMASLIDSPVNFLTLNFLTRLCAMITIFSLILSFLDIFAISLNMA